MYFYRKRFSLLLIFILLFVGCFSSLSLADGVQQVKKHKVDATYNKTATEGYNIRYPETVVLTEEEKQSILQHGSISQSDILDNAFPLLEAGNPFVLRYNTINNLNIQPLLKYGIPYFFGGRKMKNVLSYSPEYRTWIAWQDSSVYYKKDMRYFLGLDCKGFLQYVWNESCIEEYGISKNKFKDTPERCFLSGTENKDTDWIVIKNKLQIGDVLAVYHPSQHILIYIGTLSDYGYTEKDFPDDPAILDYPLAVHCGVNAVYADWFYKIKQDNGKKYKKTSVPDGGVTVSIIGYENDKLVHSISQQKQTTSWVQLPDNTWLTVITLNEGEEWYFYR